MNENTLNLSISGLAKDDITRLAELVPVRDGVSISIVDLAQVDDDRDTDDDDAGEWVEALETRAADNTARIDTLTIQIDQVRKATAEALTAAANAQDAAATAQTTANGKGVTLVQSTRPATAYRNATTLWIDTTNGKNIPKRWIGGEDWEAIPPAPANDAAPTTGTTIPATSPEQEASRAVSPGATYPEGKTPGADAGVDLPPTRTPQYLATLVTDLPRNSLVVVTGYSPDEARFGYDDLVALIDQRLIARQVRANGNQHVVVLTNGTTVRVHLRQRLHTSSAHLVIVSARHEAYTNEVSQTAALMTQQSGGRIVLMSQGSADA